MAKKLKFLGQTTFKVSFEIADKYQVGVTAWVSAKMDVSQTYWERILLNIL